MCVIYYFVRQFLCAPKHVGLPKHTHTQLRTTYDIDKPKYRTGAGSGNNKILNAIVGRSILISNFKDSATKQLALI